MTKSALPGASPPGGLRPKIDSSHACLPQKQNHSDLTPCPATTRTRFSVAFRWRFWKIQTYAEASWVLKKSQKMRGCRRKTSRISGIFLAPPTNLYNSLND